jgi:hypothetical protein
MVGCVPAPFCPRAPRNAPVPPVIAKLPATTETGFLRAWGPGVRPEVTIVPTTLPSLSKISKVSMTTTFRAVSATARPGVGAVPRLKYCWLRVMVPLAGWPLITTMSAITTALAKLFGGDAGVTLGLVANLDRSEVSSTYWTQFSMSTWMRHAYFPSLVGYSELYHYPCQREGILQMSLVHITRLRYIGGEVL